MQGLLVREKGQIALFRVGIYYAVFSKSGGRYEIADGHSLFLSSSYDSRGFFFRVIGQYGFPHRVVQATASYALLLSHSSDGSKKLKERQSPAVVKVNSLRCILPLAPGDVISLSSARPANFQNP
jgi:hypothetical protein